jgi:hypothetical protein
LRRLLYGLHAVLRLHTTQEDESFLSLADDTPAATPVGGPLVAVARAGSVLGPRCDHNAAISAKSSQAPQASAGRVRVLCRR